MRERRYSLSKKIFLAQRCKGAKRGSWKRGSALRLCAFAREISSALLPLLPRHHTGRLYSSPYRQWSRLRSLDHLRMSHDKARDQAERYLRSDEPEPVDPRIKRRIN